MVARALNAASAGGAENPVLEFSRWVQQLGSPARAVQAVAETYPEFMSTAEEHPPVEFGVLVWKDKEKDVAAVILDEEYTLSSCALNWREVKPPSNTPDLNVL